MSVTDIDNYRPHVVVTDHKGNAHVLPVSLIEDWGNGKGKRNDLVIRAIILDWLKRLEESNDS